ncbi:MAG: adenylate/guanylate cyclase domain-containing protein [Chloroflexota bacterium]
MDGATILFADIVGFSPLAARLPPARLVELLGAVFRTCDGSRTTGLETIKTIGDRYGQPLPARRSACLTTRVGRPTWRST